VLEQNIQRGFHIIGQVDDMKACPAVLAIGAGAAP
jgi:hypothetical protein